jgi:sterol desaturase/sphingolipid hydroxylase (fatty acid hydroxylase superfamily)
MEALIDYFETIPSLHRSIILVGGLTLFWLLEGAVPLFRFDYRKWRHALPNFFFTLTTIIINFGLAFLLLSSSDWVMSRDFGIINWIPELPLWLYIVLGILLLDFFGAYLPHYVEHKVKPLWMIHLVHHTDHKVDTTTANRHHPLESVIRFGFTLMGVFIIGLPIGIVILYQSMSVVATQFTHANIRLPKRVDHALSYFIVSPDMHKVHHHYVLPYTDSNYGNIFSIWDRILGTYMELDREKLVYGVDVFPDEKANSRVDSLLLQPFQKYKKPTTIPSPEYKQNDP